MKILLASDHAGIELKKNLVEALKLQNEIQDFGPHSTDSVDYPDFADLVCKNLNTSDNQPELKELGILICGSGQGMALRANKYKNIRAALVYNDEIVKLSREHNNANIICIGARYCDFETALRWINLFKNTAFAQGRHQTRVAKVSSPTS
ncbi:MAG: RpiB/LacA/LacB family sugar-phosphate isomerase [Pseudobdellovibrio sp.]